jgi:nicotinate-nucleotide adenylyltransferase
VPAIRTVAVPRVDLSSTLIRERIRAGRSVRYMVPEAVRRILDASRLYL